MAGGYQINVDEKWLLNIFSPTKGLGRMDNLDLRASTINKQQLLSKSHFPVVENCAANLTNDFWKRMMNSYYQDTLNLILNKNPG